MRKRFDVKILFGVMVATSFAPRLSAQPQSQSQSQSSGQSVSSSAGSQQGPGATAAQTQAPAKATSGSSEPQMQSQEAPPPESLGEAARKVRAQKAQASASKVYTEDKIAGLSGHGVSVVGDGNQASGSSGSENSYAQPGGDGGNRSGGATGGGKSDEQFWRNKARAIHDQMAQIDERIAKIQEEIQKYGAVSFDPASGLRQNVIYVEDRNAQIKQLEAQKARLQSQLDSLEEEGRKAGADSGWFR